MIFNSAQDPSPPCVSGFAPSTRSESDKMRNAAAKERTLRTALLLLNDLSYSYSFDVLRDLRRRACVQVATTCRSESDDMLSFVLGASSCGASLECLLEGEHFSSSFGVELDKDQTITGSRVRGPYAHLTSASHLVRRACTGDTTALAHVEATLKTALTRMGQNTSRSPKASPAVAVCFATLEKTLGKLVLGRYDGIRSSVVVLPLFAQVNQVLDDLEVALASNKASLLRTMDAEAVGRWSDDDKREWWKERRDGDKAVKNLLGKLEASLGAWKYLLYADAADMEVLSDPTRFDHVQDKGQPSLAPVAPWLSLLLKGVHEGENPTDCIIALLTQYNGSTNAESRANKIVAAERARAAKASLVISPPPSAAVEQEEGVIDSLMDAFESMKVTDLRKKLREKGFRPRASSQTSCLA